MLHDGRAHSLVAPWSPYFTVVGPWYYWNGPYDPFFWSYWPYYSFYYRSYYPSYYAGGRFFRTWRAAPAISRVPATGWRGGAASRLARLAVAVRAERHYGARPLGGAWRGIPAPATATMRPRPRAVAGAARPPAARRWRLARAATVPSPGVGWRGSPVQRARRRALRAAPSTAAAGTRPPAAASTPRPRGGGWHSAPSGGGFHGGGGGGFHSGGGFHGGRR